MSRPQVPANTIVIYSDVACPWSTVTIARLLRLRGELGLDGRVRLEHRCFPLEEVNGGPIAKRVVDAELPVVGALEPDLGLRPWRADPATWPVTTALANEAVQAARLQSDEAAEQVDLALRLALFRDSRCIAVRAEVLAVAGDCPAVDGTALAAALDDGRARGPMLREFREHRDALRGSPHLFLPDGGDVHHPGVELHWIGKPGDGYPVVDRDDQHVLADLLMHAAAGPPAGPAEG